MKPQSHGTHHGPWPAGHNPPTSHSMRCLNCDKLKFGNLVQENTDRCAKL